LCDPFGSAYSESAELLRTSHDECETQRPSASQLAAETQEAPASQHLAETQGGCAAAKSKILAAFYPAPFLDWPDGKRVKRYPEKVRD